MATTVAPHETTPTVDYDAQIPHLKSDIGLTRPDHTKGIWDWLTTVDHKKIGVMYALAGLLFFLIGGIEAMLIRIQLAVPENDFISQSTYNALFTMHGTTMIFLAVMPISSAFFNYLVPLQIGARDVAFPRLNAFSLWTFFAGAIVLHLSFLVQAATLLGWFDPSGIIGQDAMGQNLYPRVDDIIPSMSWVGYAPITGDAYTGMGTEFWILGLQILGVASVAASLNFITTILNMRAPGMTMMRLPIFTWMTLITSFLIILAFPAITIALAQLMFDRFFGTNFFEVLAGGQPILWQHLFWVFGHPEVYILILPAFGMISEILPTFSKKPLFGYPIMVFSGAVIGFLGFGVWSHHMFTGGLGTIGTAAFSLLTMAIAVPTGVKIFNWIGTLWGGRITFPVPMVLAVGFIWMFMMGGFSGIMHSAAPADAQQHDSYFVVAHFHYVLIGGSVLALMAGTYYWFPKMTGRFMNEKLGYWVSGLVIVGFNVTFFPMHFLGLLGMPRRYHTYQAGAGLEGYNLLATIGAGILFVGIFLFVVNLIHGATAGKKAPADPWGGRTLEWATTNPPQVFNFARTPIVKSRDAYWAHKRGTQPFAYVPDDGHGIHMPSKSWFPLFAGIGFLIFGTSMSLHAFTWGIIGLGVLFLSCILWALEGPGGYHLHPPADETATEPKPETVPHA